MLVIKIEMWPQGDESKKRLLEQAFIYNDGGDAGDELGNYVALLLKSPRFMKGNSVLAQLREALALVRAHQ